MSQLSFTEAEFTGKRKRARREKFLSDMHKTAPWEWLAGKIAKHYATVDPDSHTDEVLTDIKALMETPESAD